VRQVWLQRRHNLRVPAPFQSRVLQEVQRDLTLYENAGTISMGTDGQESTKRAALSQTRTFLLRRWNERSLGRVALVSIAPTGRPMTGNFYVERDGAGTWRVVLEATGRPTEEFYFVEEIGVAGDGRPILEPRSDGSQLVSRAVHLKKSAGANSGLVL
jgi:hypothetical protein